MPESATMIDLAEHIRVERLSTDEFHRLLPDLPRTVNISVTIRPKQRPMLEIVVGEDDDPVSIPDLWEVVHGPRAVPRDP